MIMAPRLSHTNNTTLGDRTLVLDPGTYTLKAGFVDHSGSSIPDPQTDCDVIQNTIARGSDPFNARKDRIYVADQLDSCRDFAEMTFRRPVEKGYIVNWDGELDVWKQVFFRDGAKLHVCICLASQLAFNASASLFPSCVLCTSDLKICFACKLTKPISATLTRPISS